MIKQAVYILILSLLSIFSSAQVPHFKKYDLPGNIVGKKITAVCEDSKKVIWIGTTGGIYRFDGEGFEELPMPASLKSKHITALSGHGSKGIIAGTDSGELIIFESDSLKEIYGSVLFTGEPVSSIVTDSSDAFWVSTSGDGVFYFEGNRIIHYTDKHGIGDNYVYAMYRDEKGTLWIGGDGGLSYLVSEGGMKRFYNLNTSHGLPENLVRKITRGPAGSLLIGLEEKGVCVYEPSLLRFINYEYIGWNDGPVSALALIGEDIWAGTLKAGLVSFRFDKLSHTHLTPLEGNFSEPDIRSVFVDSDDNVWISAGSSLFMSTGRLFTFNYLLNGYQPENVRALLLDSSGNLWLSDDKGVYFITENDSTHEIRLNYPLKGTTYDGFPVISFYEDSNGFIWLGTFDKGVLRYEKGSGKFIRFTEQQGLVNGNVLSISGLGNEVWFATLGGASRCFLTGSELQDVSPFSSYVDESGLGNNFIYSVHEDSGKRIWFGTDGVGATCFDKGVFKNYGPKDGLTSKVIYSVTEDATGKIWLNSSDHGLFVFSDGKFNNISIDQGLTTNDISAIAADKIGNLFVFHNNGFDVIDVRTFQIVSYGTESGLADISPELNSVHVGKDGMIRVGVKRGYLALGFEKAVSGKAPAAIINNVLCYFQNADTTLGNRFDYNRNYISFDYHAIWYPEPGKVNYQYRLDGYSDQWINTRDRLITFPNLPPGRYTFSVRASLSGDFTNASLSTYSFVISPPFWKTPIFMALMIVVFGLVIYVYLRYRDNKVKRIESVKREQLESQFEILRNQVNPHFLFNSFNTLISVIENDRDAAVEYVDKLSDFFRNVLAYRDKNLITVGEELELVETYIFLQKKRYGNNFVVEIDIPEQVRTRSLIPPMTLQMLIENSLKHNAVSSETPLRCSVVYSDNGCLVVSNNLNPRQSPSDSTGVGLSNIKSRFMILQNRPVLISKDEKFFTVSLPLIGHE